MEVSVKGGRHVSIWVLFSWTFVTDLKWTASYKAWIQRSTRSFVKSSWTRPRVLIDHWNGQQLSWVLKRVGITSPEGPKSELTMSRAIYTYYNHFSRYSLSKDSFFSVFALCELEVKRWSSADSVDSSLGRIRKREITTKSVNLSKLFLSKHCLT